MKKPRSLQVLFIQLIKVTLQENDTKLLQLILGRDTIKVAITL
jgi:hypothetical protein